MPHISTESVKEIRNTLKVNFPNFKFSVTRNHCSEISIKIMQSNDKALKNYDYEYLQINQYYIKENFSHAPKLAKILQKIYEIANKTNYIVTIDSDYGSIPNYYISISIGQWDKKFKYTGKNDTL